MSMRWPPRNEALKSCRRELPRKIKKDGTLYKKPNFEYPCNKCKAWFKSSDVIVDHIIPIVNPADITARSEEEYIGKFAVSLLCYTDNLQVLCEPCHDKKTKKENIIRKLVKKG